ncbi:hypothetical protein ACE1CM_13945 [Microseira sp. BLCC-F43]
MPETKGDPKNPWQRKAQINSSPLFLGVSPDKLFQIEQHLPTTILETRFPAGIWSSQTNDFS